MTGIATQRPIPSESRPRRSIEPMDSSALALRLAREFAAPAGLIDLSDRAWRACAGPEPGSPVGTADFPAPDVVAGAVLGQGESGRVFLWKPAPGRVVWLALPVGLDGSGLLWALVGFAAEPAVAAPWGPTCPEPALHAWGQAVADRLDAEAQARLPFGGRSSSRRVLRRTSPILDELIRRLRVSDPPRPLPAPGHPRPPRRAGGRRRRLGPRPSPRARRRRRGRPRAPGRALPHFDP